MKSRTLVPLGMLRNGMNIFGYGWTIRFEFSPEFRGEFNLNGSSTTKHVQTIWGTAFFSLLPEFPEFLYFFPQLAVPYYSEKTEEPKMADFKSWIVTRLTLIQFSKPFKTRPWAGLLSSLMLTEFLQHNCSLLVQTDFSFCRRYLIFLLPLLWSATKSSDKMILLNLFFFSWWAKSAVPVVQKQSTGKSIQIVSTPSGNS